MRQVLKAGSVFLLLVLGACANPPPAPDGDAPKFASHVEGSYRIGVDDRVQVTVWRNPELSVTVPVRPDGKISVPLIGDVDAGGHTPEEVAAIIRQKLSAYIRDPNVAVILTDLRSHEFLSRIRVTGAVRAPRSIPYRQGMTVLDAVLEAGGVNDFAAPNRSKLYRRDSKDRAKTDVHDVDLGDILNRGKLETNYPLLPGDVITVPERLF
jgi:polysaccharide export outer membrane protein